MSNSSITAPTQIYYTSRRNLAFFSGVLLLDNFAGLKHVNSEISLFPFTFEDISYISPALFLMFLYAVWQYWISWSTQSEEIRRYSVNFYDCMALGLVSSFSFTLFWIPPFSKYNLLLLYFLPVAWCLWALLFTRLSEKMIKNEKRQAIKREIKIIDIIDHGKWILEFNPSNSKGFKEITFNKDGGIGIGKNENENFWRVNNGLLEILNEAGSVFSRFRFNYEENIFEHTNDDDTISIRNQRIANPRFFLLEQTSKGIVLRNTILNNNLDYIRNWQNSFAEWRTKTTGICKIESKDLSQRIYHTQHNTRVPQDILPVSDSHSRDIGILTHMLEVLQTYLQESRI